MITGIAAHRHRRLVAWAPIDISACGMLATRNVRLAERAAYRHVHLPARAAYRREHLPARAAYRH